MHYYFFLPPTVTYHDIFVFIGGFVTIPFLLLAYGKIFGYCLVELILTKKHYKFIKKHGFD